MNVTYYTNFSKRINSTKIPTGGTTVAMKLKYPTSIERPAFNVVSIPTTCTYLKWDNRYYYVTGIQYDTATQITITCELDVLATFKSNILSTKAFIEYSQYNFNSDILDPRISNTAAIISNSDTLSGLNGYISATGTYILSVIGTNGTAVRYALTRAGLNALGNAISTAPSSDIDDLFVKKFGSLMACIRGCIWVPFIYSMPNNNTVVLGSYDTQIPATIISTLSNTGSVGYINVPWVNSERCRKDQETISLMLPGYGVVNLSPSAIHYEVSLNIRISYDINGNLIYILHAGGHDSYYQCNLGVEIPITQYTQSPAGMAAGWLSTLTRKLTAAGYTPNENNIFSRLEDWAQNFIPTIAGRLVNTGSTIGSIGGQGGAAMADFVSLNNDIVVVNRSYGYAEEQADMADRYGRPYFAVNTISNMLSGNKGYVKTNGASVDIPGFEDEKDKVDGFLNGGIFIE